MSCDFLLWVSHVKRDVMTYFGDISMTQGLRDGFVSLPVIHANKYISAMYKYHCWLHEDKLKVKADLKSYIPLETVAIFFLENIFPKQGISSEYVTVDFICMGLLGLQGAKTENYKMP